MGAGVLLLIALPVRACAKGNGSSPGSARGRGGIVAFQFVLLAVVGLVSTYFFIRPATSMLVASFLNAIPTVTWIVCGRGLWRSSLYVKLS